MGTEIANCRKRTTVSSEKNGFVYEYTADKDLLDQYYQLREDCYKQEWGLSVFSGVEDEHDKQGHILIVREGDKVIGGGRVVFRYNFSTLKLPMETDTFLLHEMLPEIGVGSKLIGEIGRIAVLPEYRGHKLADIGFYLLAKSQLCGCHYLTTVAPVKQAVRYTRIADKFGIKISTMESIPVADHPYYNHIEMRLLICDISGLPDCSYLLAR